MVLFNEFTVFFRSHIDAHLKPATVRQYSYVIKQILNPEFGHLNLDSVQRAQVNKLHLSMADRPVVANRMLAVGKRIYSFAQEVGELPDQINPFTKIRHFKERPRERFLSCEEYERLGNVLNQMELEGRYHPASFAAIRLIALTGARRSEIESLKWSYVDFDNNLIRLADSKTGGRNLELSGDVRQILESLPVAGEYVMSRRDGTKAGLQRIWNQIRVRAGLKDVRLHDLRHSYATHAALSGVPLPVIAQLLGHSTTWTTSRYLHVSNDSASHAAEQVSSMLTSAMCDAPDNRSVSTVS